VESGVNEARQKTARLFFAIQPPIEIRSVLNGLAKKVTSIPNGRSVKRDNIHLTLVFLGDVAVDKINTLCEIAVGITALPFSLLIQGTTYWKKNRMVMANCEQFPAELFALAEALKSALVAAGFDCEERQYRPHITLVRNANEHKAVQLEMPIQWNVNDWVLMQSRLSVDGVRYTELGRWSCRFCK